jgi:hypothetical protein
MFDAAGISLQPAFKGLNHGFELVCIGQIKKNCCFVILFIKKFNPKKNSIAFENAAPQFLKTEVFGKRS